MISRVRFRIRENSEKKVIQWKRCSDTKGDDYGLKTTMGTRRNVDRHNLIVGKERLSEWPYENGDSFSAGSRVQYYVKAAIRWRNRFAKAVVFVSSSIPFSLRRSGTFFLSFSFTFTEDVNVARKAATTSCHAHPIFIVQELNYSYSEGRIRV